MNRAAFNLRVFFSMVFRKASIRRFFHFFLVLVINIGGAGLITAAQVAPAYQDLVFINKTFHLNATVPTMICIGHDYSVKVGMYVDISGIRGDQNISVENRDVPGINIQSTSQNSAVAAISPAKLRSGHLPVDLTAVPNYGNADAMGDVVFTLHPIKPGSTRLTFNATVPGQLTGGTAESNSIANDITVQYCKFKVTFSGNWSAHYPNLTSTLNEIAKGEISQDATGEFTGTANVQWKMRSFSMLCSHKQTIPNAQAHLGAQFDGNYIHVSIEHDPFQMGTGNCGSGSTGQFQAPKFYIGMAATGGTVGTTSTFTVGKEVMRGNVTMTVVPLPIR